MHTKRTQVSRGYNRLGCSIADLAQQTGDSPKIVPQRNRLSQADAGDIGGNGAVYDALVKTAHGQDGMADSRLALAHVQDEDPPEGRV